MSPDPWKLLFDRMDAQDERLDRIEKKVDHTNGDVRDLKLWRARMQGAAAAYKWVGPLFTAVIAGIGGTVLTLLVGGH